MDFVRRNWAQARAYMQEMTFAQKWGVGAVLIILLLFGALAMIYAGAPEKVAITQFAGGRQVEVMARLQAHGINVEQKGNQLLVPRQQQEEAIALLVEGNLLSEDASESFKQLVLQQSPWLTNEQNRQRYHLALNTALGSILRKIRGVRSAQVVVSMPQEKGFGSSFVRPTASVTLSLEGGRRIDERLVEAVAGLVAGAVAEMAPQQVVVIDAGTGQQHKVGDANELVAGDLVELIRSEERHYREKIGELLRIRHAIVAVTVRADPTHREIRSETDYEKAEPLRETENETISRRNLTQAGEPGVRPNVGASIDGGSGVGMEESIERTRETFGEKRAVVRSEKTITGHTVQQVNVAINIPRSYFVQIYRARNPQQGDLPVDDVALQPLFEQQRAEIEAKVRPLVEAVGQQSVVRADMFYDDADFLQPLALASGAGGLAGVLEAPWMTPATLLGTALLAVAFMFFMLRHAAQKEVLPTVEELAGLPPTLAGDEDLIGEADEMEMMMSGVELDEEQLRARKIADQISEMIKASPEEAGSLIGKWVRPDD